MLESNQAENCRYLHFRFVFGEVYVDSVSAPTGMPLWISSAQQESFGKWVSEWWRRGIYLIDFYWFPVRKALHPHKMSIVILKQWISSLPPPPREKHKAVEYMQTIKLLNKIWSIKCSQCNKFRSSSLTFTDFFLILLSTVYSDPWPCCAVQDYLRVQLTLCRHTPTLSAQCGIIFDVHSKNRTNLYDG